jgi:hypothetical protein
MFKFFHLSVNKNWDKFKLISGTIIVLMFVGGDRAMGRLLKAEAGFKSQLSPCDVCGGESPS